MAATTAELFMGRVVRSTTIGSARRTFDLAKARQQRVEDQLRIQKRLGRGKMSSKTFLPGERVRIQDPKTLKWSVTGVVTKAIYHQGGSQPSSYEVTTDNSSSSFLRNGKFLRLREEQNIPEQTMNADRKS